MTFPNAGAHSVALMPVRDQQQIERLALSYTEAWCSHDAGRVADHYAPGGMIAINGGEPARIAEVAHSFVAAFPDIETTLLNTTGRSPARAPTRASACASQVLRTGRSALTGSSLSRWVTTTRLNTTASCSMASARPASASVRGHS